MINKKILVPANAKINLYLDVLSRYESGFHEISSVMQTVSLCDNVEVSVQEGDGIEVVCDREGVPAGTGNIAYKAAAEYLRESGNNLFVSVRIEKNIPVAAGLAGGSADAAATLAALDMLSDAPLGRQKALEIASRRSDALLPYRGTMSAGGRGKRFSRLYRMNVLVACGGRGFHPVGAAFLTRNMATLLKGGFRTPGICARRA